MLHFDNWLVVGTLHFPEGESAEHALIALERFFEPKFDDTHTLLTGSYFAPIHSHFVSEGEPLQVLIENTPAPPPAPPPPPIREVTFKISPYLL